MKSPDVEMFRKMTFRFATCDPAAHLTVKLNGGRKDSWGAELPLMSRAGHLISDLTGVASAIDPKQEGRKLLIARQNLATLKRTAAREALD